MTKVKIHPGICGLDTLVEAESEDGLEVKVKIRSGCKTIKEMTKEIGDTWDAYEVCLGKPGTGPIYDYAREKLPGHASCPAIAGIIKCVEVECNLALPAPVSIEFV